MKTLLILCTLLFSTDAYSEEVIDGRLVEQCLNTKETTDDFCNCAVSAATKQFSQDEIDMSFGEFNDENLPIIRKVSKLLTPSSDNACSHNYDSPTADLQKWCVDWAELDALDEDNFASVEKSAPKLCRCRVSAIRQMASDDKLKAFLRNKKETSPFHLKVIAMLEGKDTQLNQKCQKKGT